MSYFKSQDYFGESITSEVGTFIKAKSHQSNEIFDYIISFIYEKDDVNYFYIIRCSFLSNDLSRAYNKLFSKEQTNSNRKITSCFQTVSQKIVCLYQYSDLTYNIIVFDEVNNRQLITALDTGENYLYGDIKVYFKGIHLKEEIGIFLYYKSITYTNPILSLKYVNSNLGMTTYKSYNSINIQKSDYNR